MNPAMRLRGCLTRPRFAATRWGRIFAGPEGIRTGWRLSLFLLLLLCPLVPEYLGFVALSHHLSPALIRPPFHPLIIGINELIILVPLCIATFIMAYLEDKPFTRYGLQDRAWLQRLGLGLAMGVACLALLIGILGGLDLAYAKPGGLSGLADLRYGAEWWVVSVLVAFTEEFMLRGYFLATLAGGIGFWPAAFVSSALFALTHVPNKGEAIIGLLQVGAIAMLFCFSLRRTGALWCAIGIHAGWDFAENFLFGTHDSGRACYATLLTTILHGNPLLSGGDVGPEGSLFGLAVPLLLALILNKIYPSKKFHSLPIAA
jgi:membrane protease YdiL (CAAX protease family)